MYLVAGRATPREVAAMRKADEKEARREARAEKDRKRANFWDNIDTSAGLWGCHPWTGKTNNNHNITPGAESFDYGQFSEAGCRSNIATRVLCFKLYGKEPPRNKDITPTCRNHLCCNPSHLLVTPKRRLATKLQDGTPIVEFFAFYCEPVGAN